MTDQDPTGQDGQQPKPTGEAEPQAKADTPTGEPAATPNSAALTAAEADADKWKRQARKHEDELKGLRQQVKSLVDPSEVKSVEDRLDDATGQLAKAEAEALRFRVALEEGLPPDLAKRLVGGTEKEIRADAQQLKELVKQPAAGAVDAAAVAGPNTTEPQPKDLSALMRAAVAKR